MNVSLKLWPFTYVKEGFKLADDYKADIFINAKTSDLNEEDYKFLLKNFGYENFISYKMENEIFQKDCIKHNQKIKAQILDEIEK